MDKDSLSFLSPQGSGVDRSSKSEVRDRQFDGLGDPLLILPGQHFASAGLERAPHVEGERRLLGAILEDAFNCFRKYSFASDKRGRELYRQAEEWFMTEDCGAPISFEYVCQTRELDPDAIRSALRRWQRQQSTKLGQQTDAADPAEKSSSAPGDHAWAAATFQRASGE